MECKIAPIPANEMDRILNLYDFGIDYSNLENTFEDLTFLAAKICGTEISLINLIDSYTQWSIANFGIEISQIPREDSICQYTILEPDYLEVADLSTDQRFQHKSYVNNPLNLRYYCGVPLRTKSGHNIGSLCILDRAVQNLSEEKIELLKVIANEIVTRLNTMKVMQELRSSLSAAQETSKKVAHDLRAPISGIIGLAEIIEQQGDQNTMDGVLGLVKLIHKSGTSMLELADEILTDNNSGEVFDHLFDLSTLKSQLLKLYAPQAKTKDIEFVVNLIGDNNNVPIAQRQLMQIVGNLVSNAIKFTQVNGKIAVDLDLELSKISKTFKISVVDSGIGMTQDKIDQILAGNNTTTQGTDGEAGYGFGLKMVKNLIENLGGTMQIHSIQEDGTRFELSIPQLESSG